MEQTPSAEEIIQKSVEEVEGGNIAAVKQQIDMNVQEVTADTRDLVHQQFMSIQGAVPSDFAIEDLPGNVAGLFDNGSLAIDDQVVANGNVEQIRQIVAHEQYHQQHHNGSFVVSPGMDSTAIIEAMTVIRTGDAFVSAQYRQYKAEFLTHISTLGISLNEAEKIIDSHDLTLLQPDAQEKVAA